MAQVNSSWRCMLRDRKSQKITYSCREGPKSDSLSVAIVKTSPGDQLHTVGSTCSAVLGIVGCFLTDHINVYILPTDSVPCMFQPDMNQTYSTEQYRRNLSFIPLNQQISNFPFLKAPAWTSLPPFASPRLPYSSSSVVFGAFPEG